MYQVVIKEEGEVGVENEGCKSVEQMKEERRKRERVGGNKKTEEKVGRERKCIIVRDRRRK